MRERVSKPSVVLHLHQDQFLRFSSFTVMPDIREEFYSEGAEYYKKEDDLWTSKPSVVESRHGVVAADDGRCSEVGVSILEKGGNAVDAAIAVVLCLGVVSPTSSGIGGGGFMLVRYSFSQETIVVNMRETAPLAASGDMYANDPKAKSAGPSSLGVPGEIAGLFAAWGKHHSLERKELFEPAIKYAREGFKISPFTGYYLVESSDSIMNDPGLSELFVRNGKLLKAGDVCYNPELANTLEAIAEQGPKALYDGPIGEKLVDEVQRAGGILTMDDLRNYEAIVTDAISTVVSGYEILGVPPPASGALVGSVLNILDGYERKDIRKDPVVLHRLVEAMKHVFAKKMNLGDEDVCDEAVSNMLSSSFAAGIREKIDDKKTFNATHYGPRLSQAVDHGTSHIIIVDKDRNVVSLTTSLNDRFGGGMRSMSTGIILNNVMADFAMPTDEIHDNLLPAETNFIEPNKRPLSSMTPIIVLKNDQFVGAIGGGGGSNIIPAVIQIFINHFWSKMGPFEAVQTPRIYLSLDPESVYYESWRVFNGEHFELSEDKRQSLANRGHILESVDGGAICQFVVQSRGILTAVTDPRKGGWPAGSVS